MNKTRKAKQLTFSVLLLIIAFMMAATSTLAWLSVNTKASVTGIDFEVTAEDGIYIATKQWMFGESEVYRKEAIRIEATAHPTSSGYYVYNYNSVEKTTKNVKKEGDKYYVYILQYSLHYEEVVKPDDYIFSGNYIYTDSEDVFGYEYKNTDYSVLGAGVEPDKYTLEGRFLVEPQNQHFAESVPATDIAKVVMNDWTATKITDGLREATTASTINSVPLDIVNLVDKTGAAFDLYRPGAGGQRNLISLNSRGEGITYKIEFDLYFRSQSQYGIKFDTVSSKVSSTSGNNMNIKAWEDLTTANYTSDADVLAKYGNTITRGTEIKADAKDALRVGFTSSEQKAIGIWDPNITKGWNLNNTNLALDYYNKINGTALTGTPHTADITAYNNFLFHEMKPISGGYFQEKITVTMWLEGFDADCFDSIMSSTMTVELYFGGEAVI